MLSFICGFRCLQSTITRNNVLKSYLDGNKKLLDIVSKLDIDEYKLNGIFINRTENDKKLFKLDDDISSIYDYVLKKTFPTTLSKILPDDVKTISKLSLEKMISILDYGIKINVRKSSDKLIDLLKINHQDLTDFLYKISTDQYITLKEFEYLIDGLSKSDNKIELIKYLNELDQDSLIQIISLFGKLKSSNDIDLMISYLKNFPIEKESSELFNELLNLNKLSIEKLNQFVNFLSISKIQKSIFKNDRFNTQLQFFRNLRTNSKRIVPLYFPEEKESIPEYTSTIRFNPNIIETEFRPNAPLTKFRQNTINIISDLKIK